MNNEYVCDDCGQSSSDLDENVLHELVVSIVRGKQADALVAVERLVRDHPNADALSERIAIARAAA